MNQVLITKVSALNPACLRAPLRYTLLTSGKGPMPTSMGLFVNLEMMQIQKQGIIRRISMVIPVSFFMGLVNFIANLALDYPL
jgi:hypothetical protein